MKTNYKYLFGPVPSRRLGRSLGIDVTPFKTCSFDCIFCQLGCTTQLVTERGEFVPYDEVCSELEQWLRENGRADYITFAGSGEPTLYNRLGELIDFIKARTEIPVIVLSNGTLLHRPAVRAALQHADIVKVSLSAWDEASFQQINRPAPELNFDLLLAGERALREEFTGQLWLETFLLEGINAAPEQVRRIAAAAETVKPDKIQLNTAVRPPAEKSARPVAPATLNSLCELFTPRAEAVTSFETAPLSETGELNIDGLVCLIHRHPATAEQLAAISGADVDEIRRRLAPLLEEGLLQMEVRSEDIYYK